VFSSVADLGAILDIDCVWNPNLRESVGMDWQVVEWVVDEWCSGWVKSDKCKVYLLYCIDISGKCPFVFVKIGVPQKRPVLISKHSCTHCCCLSPLLSLFLTPLLSGIIEIFSYFFFYKKY
jgi:hypothetical protein